MQNSFPLQDKVLVCWGMYVHYRNNSHVPNKIHNFHLKTTFADKSLFSFGTIFKQKHCLKLRITLITLHKRVLSCST